MHGAVRSSYGVGVCRSHGTRNVATGPSDLCDKATKRVGRHDCSFPPFCYPDFSYPTFFRYGEYVTGGTYRTLVTGGTFPLRWHGIVHPVHHYAHPAHRYRWHVPLVTGGDPLSSQSALSISTTSNRTRHCRFLQGAPTQISPHPQLLLHIHFLRSSTSRNRPFPHTSRNQLPYTHFP